jgi:tRNA(adenine34) deaminase
VYHKIMVLVSGSLVTTHNHVQRGRNPLLHAEIILLQLLCHHMKSPFLEHVWIFSTLEPCALCAAALIRHRVAGVVFGAYNPQEGGVVHQKFPKHISVIGGVRELECQNLLDNFFLRQRSKIIW